MASIGRRLGGIGSISLPVILSFIAGLLIGWVLLGWWLFPVNWTDASPPDLAKPYQIDYLAMVADSYAQNGNLNLAMARLKGFSAQTIEANANELGQKGFLQQATVLRGLSQVVALNAQAGTPAAAATTRPTPQVTPTTAAPAAPVQPASLADRLRLVCGALFLVMLLLVGLGVAGYSLSRRPVARPTTGSAPLSSQPLKNIPSMPTRKRVVLNESIVSTYRSGDPGYGYWIDDPGGEQVGSWQLQPPGHLSSTERANTPVVELSLTDQETNRVERRALVGPEAVTDEATHTAYQSSVKPMPVQRDQEISLDVGQLHLQARVIDLAESPVGSSLGRVRLDYITLQVRVTRTSEGQAADIRSIPIAPAPNPPAPGYSEAEPDGDDDSSGPAA